MKAIWTWLVSIWAMLTTKRTTPEVPMMHNETWNPIIAAAVERERQSMILHKLRNFMRSKPRPWLSPQARAQAKRRQRRNAVAQIEKRLSGRRGLQ